MTRSIALVAAAAILQFGGAFAFAIANPPAAAAPAAPTVGLAGACIERIVGVELPVPCERP